jgi:hypothetical protein
MLLRSRAALPPATHCKCVVCFCFMALTILLLQLRRRPSAFGGCACVSASCCSAPPPARHSRVMVRSARLRRQASCRGWHARGCKVCVCVCVCVFIVRAVSLGGEQARGSLPEAAGCWFDVFGSARSGVRIPATAYARKHIVLSEHDPLEENKCWGLGCHGGPGQPRDYSPQPWLLVIGCTAGAATARVNARARPEAARVVFPGCPLRLQLPGPLLLLRCCRRSVCIGVCVTISLALSPL